VLRETGIKRHSVEYSLGSMDRTITCPTAGARALTCAAMHGLPQSVEKMIAYVKENERTPEEPRFLRGSALRF